MRAASVVILAVLLAGCATQGVPVDPANPGSTAPGSSSPGSSSPASIRPSLTSPEPTPLPTSPAPVPSGEPAAVPAASWQAILDDLAGRGVARDAVVLVTAERVTWPDGSLGCPEPGMLYTQALVDGMRVVVEADAVRYDYRLGREGRPRLCQQ